LDFEAKIEDYSCMGHTSERTFDPYSVLRISRNASTEEIRAAYRRLVKKVHPDHNRSRTAESKFMLVQRAYELLADPARRDEWDTEHAVEEPADVADPDVGKPAPAEPTPER
jgi:DnaJ-class molecular chaperone